MDGKGVRVCNVSAGEAYKEINLMTTHFSEISTAESARTYAKIAGWLYLIIIVSGVFGEGFVRGTLIDRGDAAATVANILAAEGLFRIGFFADVMMLLSDVTIAILLYILLRPVSNLLSMMAAAFRLTQAAVLGLNLLHYYAALLLIKAGAGLETVQLNTLVQWLLEVHSHGYDLGLFFFAISCALGGYLVVKSTFFPTSIGYGLIAAGGVYLIGSFTRFLFPDSFSTVQYLYVIPLIAELAFALWLVIKGVREETPAV